MGGTGLEHPAITPPETPISEKRGTKSGTLDARNEPDLALIVARWPDLPEHVKAAVMALVRTTSDKEPSQ